MATHSVTSRPVPADNDARADPLDLRIGRVSVNGTQAFLVLERRVGTNFNL